MKRYVSRKKNRAAAVLFWSFLGLFLIGKGTASLPLMLAAWPLLAAGVALMFTANRCPYCGAYFRGVYWSKPSAGYCAKCGKLIEFDDCVPQDDGE